MRVPLALLFFVGGAGAFTAQPSRGSALGQNPHGVRSARDAASVSAAGLGLLSVIVLVEQLPTPE